MFMLCACVCLFACWHVGVLLCMFACAFGRVIGLLDACVCVFAWLCGCVIVCLCGCWLRAQLVAYVCGCV